MSDRVDPGFPRYLIPKTTIDGPLQPEGTEVALRLWARVEKVPLWAERAEGEPVPLMIIDFGGPVPGKADPGPNPPAIPEELLNACEHALAVAGQAPGPFSRRDAAAAVLAEVARRLRFPDDEASSLAIGVLKLDVEKLTKIGDDVAEYLRAVVKEWETTVPVGSNLEPPTIALERLAKWSGQAHGDWSDLHALRRST